eukprot:COSAG01_NODE_15013_length_1385_cov_1.798600_2_plen_170_part_01
MQIHFGPDKQKVIDEGETVRAMLDAKRAGKIRFLGASCDGDYARQCIEMGVFDVVQLAYSLIDRANEANIEACRAAGIGVFVRCALPTLKLSSLWRRVRLHHLSAGRCSECCAVLSDVRLHLLGGSDVMMPHACGHARAARASATASSPPRIMQEGQLDAIADEAERAKL